MEKLDLNILDNIMGGTKLPYIVKAGDTLTKIASHFHTTVEDLCKWNQIKDPNIITEGQRLVIKF